MFPDKSPFIIKEPYASELLAKLRCYRTNTLTPEEQKQEEDLKQRNSSGPIVIWISPELSDIHITYVLTED